MRIIASELKKILEKHNEWLVSGGNKGEKANLQGINFTDTKIRHVNFQSAELIETNFGSNDLSSTNLRDANLQDANLESVKGLSIKQLAGTNLQGAKLPGYLGDIGNLSKVEEMSRNARKIFQVMLFACLYAILTIGTTNDVNLLTNSASSPLPVLGAAIPIAWFYIIGSVFLLGCYGYLHLYLQRLWEELAFLPAIFPDGRRLDEKAYPWMLNGVMCAHFKRLEKEQPYLFSLQRIFSIIFAWMSVPITLFFFWFRYLPKHDWVGSVILSSVFGFCAIFGTVFYDMASFTVKVGGVNYAYLGLFKRIKTWITFLLCGSLIAFSYKIINGKCPDFMSFLCDKTTANFIKEDVSKKPENWTGKDLGQIDLVKGARLIGSNLRYMQGYRAFLVKADLEDADLQKANLVEADLKLAHLKSANLQHANLEKADLRRAVLEGADLSGAKLLAAKLNGADLELANFEKADLTWAVLDSADLELSKFHEADLRDADFKSAKLQGAEFKGAKLMRAKFFGAKINYADFQAADLSKAAFGGIKLAGVNFQTANLRGTELQGTELEDTDLRGAILDGAYFKGANLSGAIGLTKEQIESAYIDDRTKLPDYLQDSIKPNNKTQ